MSILNKAGRPLPMEVAMNAMTKENDVKITTFSLPVNLYHKFKLKCVKDNVSMKDVIIKSINQYINE